MKLVYTSSPSHDILRDYIFLGTMCEEWELIEYRVEAKGVGNYREDDWNDVIIKRAHHRLQTVKDNPGEIIVFADVDIQWFKPVQDDLRKALEKYDIVFQKECPNSIKVNGGFIACVCNAQTILFLTNTLAHLERLKATSMTISDQATFNGLVIQNRVPCALDRLPPCYFNDNFTFNMCPLDEIKMYHSIGTAAKDGKSSVQIKLEQHIRTRSLILGTHSIFKTKMI